MRKVVITFSDHSFDIYLSDKDLEELQRHLSDPAKRWYRVVYPDGSELWVNLQGVKFVSFGVSE